MTIHQEFLNFEVVIAHCETRVPSGTLCEAIKYGRKMDFIDERNKLSPSGELLAEIITNCSPSDELLAEIKLPTI
ncbi:hypothetical protein N9N27_02730 [Planktomarina sp.]|nr:hypothetical protein [Planktomarina sp.]